MDRYGAGIKGELLAKEHLVKNGYEIIAQNVNYPNIGEIDLVVKRGGLLAFVEVKARFDYGYGSPFEAVTKAKQRRIIKASRRFLAENRIFAHTYRYDVIVIVNDNITHLEGAFETN